MKNSAIKVIKTIFKKKNVNKSKFYLNDKAILLGISILFILSVSVYFSRPIFFNYSSDQKIIENKIKSVFKLNINITGAISYKIFPSPRIEITKTNLNFEGTKNKIFLEKVYLPISIFNIKNIKSLEFKKFLILNETIKVNPKDFFNYLKYFTILKEKDVFFKNCSFFFLDDQGNKVIFSNFNLKEKFNNNNHTINIQTIFSNKKVNVLFKNKIKEEKNLAIKIPELNTDIKIIFDPISNLSGVKAKSKIKILDNIFIINFSGKNKFEIYNSFFRNKFLNSKIDGNVSFINNFFFNFDLDINQINFRKFILYYFHPNKNFNFLDSGISKKINGKLNILMKNTNSFIGRIKDVKMLLLFENGELRIQEGSAILPKDSKLNFNILYSSNFKKPFLDFSVNFLTDNKKIFLRKFNLYNSTNEDISLTFNGKIDLKSNKIKLSKVVLNKKKLGRSDILNIEKNFNEFVLDENIIGITDFFKIKKFAQETFG